MTEFVRISRTASRDGNLSQSRVDGGPWPFGPRVLAWPCPDADTAARFGRILAGDLNASPARARFAAPTAGERHPDDPEPGELCRRCGVAEAYAQDTRCAACKRLERRERMIARGEDPDINRRAIAGRERSRLAAEAASVRTEKTCRVCGTVKPLADFGPDSRALDKTKGTCRLCIADRRRTEYVGTPRPVRGTARRVPPQSERTGIAKARGGRRVAVYARMASQPVLF